MKPMMELSLENSTNTIWTIENSIYRVLVQQNVEVINEYHSAALTLIIFWSILWKIHYISNTIQAYTQLRPNGIKLGKYRTNLRAFSISSKYSVSVFFIERLWHATAEYWYISNSNVVNFQHICGTATTSSRALCKPRVHICKKSFIHLWVWCSALLWSPMPNCTLAEASGDLRQDDLSEAENNAGAQNEPQNLPTYKWGT